MGKSVQNKPIDRKKKEENAPSEKNVIPGLNAETGEGDEKCDPPLSTQFFVCEPGKVRSYLGTSH